MAGYAGAVDQGTTSTRFIIFDREGNIVSLGQKEHRQIFPKPGWVEHDGQEIWDNTREVIKEAMDKAGITGRDLAAIGVTNQRETTLLWERRTGKPLCNALVWQDTRTDRICADLARDGGIDRFRSRTGLPLATYFSGPKIKWLMDNEPGVRQAVKEGNALFGNMDTWVIWNLSGGVSGGVHVTDVTNASRTMLMSLETLDWDDEILGLLNIPRSILPRIAPSSAVYGSTGGGCPLRRSRAHQRRPGRPAGGPCGPDLL